MSNALLEVSFYCLPHYLLPNYLKPAYYFILHQGKVLFVVLFNIFMRKRWYFVEILLLCINISIILLWIKLLSQLINPSYHQILIQSAHHYIQRTLPIRSTLPLNKQLITEAANYSEPDRNTVVHQPVSSKLRQYTTLRSQCERFT